MKGLFQKGKTNKYIHTLSKYDKAYTCMEKYMLLQTQWCRFSLYTSQNEEKAERKIGFKDILTFSPSPTYVASCTILGCFWKVGE